MTDSPLDLDAMEARAAAVAHHRTGPGRCACGYDAYKVGGFFPDYHAMLMNHLGRAPRAVTPANTDDVLALVAALRKAQAEVERLREEVERLIHHEASLLATGTRYYSEREAARAEAQAFTYWRDGMAAILPDEYREEGAAVEVSIEDAYGDGIAALAASTAHAALVAELRALVAAAHARGAADPMRCLIEEEDVTALLDRHAPTTGATP